MYMISPDISSCSLFLNFYIVCRNTHCVLFYFCLFAFVQLSVTLLQLYVGLWVSQLKKRRQLDAAAFLLDRTRLGGGKKI